MAAVHVIGAGLAGLSCAMALAERGRRVTLYEAAAEAGGRCRSFADRRLGRVLDNGTHVVFGGNRATMAYLNQLGAEERLVEAGALVLTDLASGCTHRFDAGASRFPTWLFSRARRPPGTRAWHYASLLRVLAASPKRTVGDVIATSHPLFRGFWEPLTLAALNAPVSDASARLLGTVLRRTLARGGTAATPFLVRDTLADTFIDPAIAWLRRQGVALSTRAPLRGILAVDGGVRRLDFSGGSVSVEGDHIVLAVPPSTAAKLVPGLTVPDRGHAILNLHLAVPDLVPAAPRLIGLIGGSGHWLALRRGLVTVTVSGADRLLDRDPAGLAAQLWAEAQHALGWQGRGLPPWRLVKERAATFRPDPRNLHRRPEARTAWRNLWLAGDWTDTGLPATIESAVVSGRRAAAALLAARA